MKILNIKIIPLLLILLFGTGYSFAQDSKDNPSDDNPAAIDTRPIIEVAEFDKGPEVEFPTDYYDEFAEIMINKLKKSEKFSQVVLSDDSDDKDSSKPADKDEKEKSSDNDSKDFDQKLPKRFHLSGTIINYKNEKGVRWLLLGFRITQWIVVKITLKDLETGKIILEREVDGRMAFPPQRSNAPRELAMKGVAIEAVRYIKRTVSKMK